MTERLKRAVADVIAKAEFRQRIYAVDPPRRTYGGRLDRYYVVPVFAIRELRQAWEAEPPERDSEVETGGQG